ncbi:MAG TPA: LD-carboxypeptidase [Symbiobacteriaceae bacterium]|nr:LD-carboxypeptidase [Symbiobacteriaceae bacterium]
MAQSLQPPVTPGIRKAPRLQYGDTIGVVAPAGPVPAEALEEGLARLRSWGYRTAVGHAVLNRRGYLAGNDAERAADFHRMWANPQVKGIICARGGYGAMRILERLDWELIARTPKFFCGFSDITALHVAMERKAGLVTFHGPMTAAMGSAVTYNTAGQQTAMQATEPLGAVPWPEPGEGAPVPQAIRPGVAEGRLAGGNLSLLAALMGTPWEPDFAGRIVLLEDVDEAPYRVDRMLMHLLLAGKLQQAAGIVFGDSPSCMKGPEGKPSLTLAEVLEDHLGGLGIPVLYGFPCGHTGYRATIPLGVQARLDAGAGALTVLEGALV